MSSSTFRKLLGGSKNGQPANTELTFAVTHNKLWCWRNKMADLETTLRTIAGTRVVQEHWSVLGSDLREMRRIIGFVQSEMDEKLQGASLLKWKEQEV